MLIRYGGMCYHAHFAGEFGFDRFLSIHLLVALCFLLAQWDFFSSIRTTYMEYVISKYAIMIFFCFEFGGKCS